jgi:hypothetical protein
VQFVEYRGENIPVSWLYSEILKVFNLSGMSAAWGRILKNRRLENKYEVED